MLQVIVQRKETLGTLGAVDILLVLAIEAVIDQDHHLPSGPKPPSCWYVVQIPAVPGFRCRRHLGRWLLSA